MQYDVVWYIINVYITQYEVLEEDKMSVAITGYLVGTMDHWNDAKTAEEADRVKHTLYENNTVETL